MNGYDCSEAEDTFGQETNLGYKRDERIAELEREISSLIEVYWDAEAGVWVAKFIWLNIISQGETRPEAIEAVKEAARLHQATSRDLLAMMREKCNEVRRQLAAFTTPMPCGHPQAAAVDTSDPPMCGICCLQEQLAAVRKERNEFAAALIKYELHHHECNSLYPEKLVQDGHGGWDFGPDGQCNCYLSHPRALLEAHDATLVKPLVEALKRAIRALQFVDSPEGRVCSYGDLADELDAALAPYKTDCAGGKKE